GAIETGAANLARHLGIVREFGLGAVVAVNRFPDDTDEEIELVRRLGFERGGPGAAALAEAVVAAAEAPSSFDYAYPLEAPIEAKIEAIATRVYGADGIALLPAAKDKIARFTRDGLDRLPICMAKTH